MSVNKYPSCLENSFHSLKQKIVSIYKYLSVYEIVSRASLHFQSFYYESLTPFHAVNFSKSVFLNIREQIVIEYIL